MNLQNQKPQTYRIRICILIITLCTAAFDKGWSKEGLDWWDFFPVRYLEASPHFIGNSQLEAFLEHINQINSRFELMRGLVINAQRLLFSLPHRAKVQERKLPCIRKQKVGQTYSQFTLTARDGPLWLSGGRPSWNTARCWGVGWRLYHLTLAPQEAMKTRAPYHIGSKMLSGNHPLPSFDLLDSCLHQGLAPKDYLLSCQLSNKCEQILLLNTLGYFFLLW